MIAATHAQPIDEAMDRLADLTGALLLITGYYAWQFLPYLKIGV
jgi:hypothetical protein